MKQIVAYTDGSCLKNPGPGGWGVVLVYPERVVQFSGGEKFTTNNRMEMMAAIRLLEDLDQPHEIDLYTDSLYVKNGITVWMPGWEAKNWSNVKNVDLWKRMKEVAKRHKVKWRWVRGHSGDKYNDMADLIATTEAKKWSAYAE